MCLDADGGHINCLLTTLFLFHLPELIAAGKVFCAVPPLYKVTKGKEQHYLYSDSELDSYMKRGYEVNRYKGLGEMNPSQLWESTMDPDTRELIELTTEDLEETLALYTTMMGKSSKERKQFILQHARKYSLSDEDDSDYDVEGDE